MAELTFQESEKIDQNLNELKMLGELVWSAGMTDDHVVSADSLITLGAKIRDIAYDLDSCLNGEKEAKNEQSVRKAD